MSDEIVTTDDVVAQCDQFLADPWGSGTPSDGQAIVALFRALRALAVRLRDLEPAPAEPPA